MFVLHSKKFQYAYVSAAALISFTLLAANFPRELSYSGRLTDTVGKPALGPVNLQVSFYNAATNGVVLGASPYTFNDVELNAGIFTITLNFPAAELHSIFGNTSQPVWLEIKDLTHNHLYSRQRFSIVPYALKTPVDGGSIGYNAQGELQVLNVEQNQVTGLSTALAGKAAAADLAGKADATHTHSLAGDLSGNLNAAVVSKIKGVSVLTPAPGTDNGKYLSYDGSSLKLIIMSQALGTTDASALTSGILDEARLSSNVSLLGTSIDTAEIVDGAITAAKLNSMSCSSNQVLKFNGTSWICAADHDTFTTDASLFTSGTLPNARLTANVSLLGALIETSEITDAAVTAVKLNAMGCASGQILKFNGTGWICSADNDSTITDAAALTSGTLADARLSSNVSLLGSSIDTLEITDGAITAAKLSTMGCTSGQILKFNGTSWVCAADDAGATIDAGLITSGTLTDARLSANVSLLGSSIDTAEIIDGAVTSAKMATGAVGLAQLADGSVTSAKLANHAIGTVHLADGAITATKLNAMGCTNGQILKYDGTSWLCGSDNSATTTTSASDVTSGTLADARLSGNVSLLGSSIDTAEIADGAVTSAKIATGAIGLTELADGGISSAKVVSGAIGPTQLADSGVTTAKIADGAITAAKLSTTSCTNGQILKFNGTSWGCSADTIGALTTDASLLTSGTLADARLSANVSLLGSSIDTAEITNAAVTTTKIADGAVTAAKLNAMGCMSGQILKFNGTSWVCAADTAAPLITDASLLTSGTLADSRLSSNVSLLGSSIETAEISDDAVTTAKLADGAITLAKLNAMGCVSNQVLKYNGTSWGCAVDNAGSLTSDAGDLTSGTLADARLSANVSLLGSSIDTAELTASAVTTDKIDDGAITADKLGVSCTNGQILKYNGTTWVCAADSIGSATTDASALTSGILADARLSANVSLLGTSIDTGEITDGAVTSGKIAAGTVSLTELADGSVNSSKLVNGAVDTAQLADSGVTSAKITDAAITAAKLSAMGCTSGQILKFNGTSWGCATDNSASATSSAGALTSGTLADARLSSNVSQLGSAIDTAEITDSSVTSAKIADGAVTAVKLNAMGCASGQILKYNGTSWACAADNAAAATTDASALTSGTLADARLSANVSLLGSSIETTEISNGAVTSAKFAAGAADLTALADGGVSSAKLANGAIGTAELADGGVTTVKIADGSVTAAKLNAMGCASGQILIHNGTTWVCAAEGSYAATADAGALTSGILADARLSSNVSLLGSSIDTAEIAAGAVTSAKIAAGAIGTTELADGAVSAAKFANGSIGTTQLAGISVTTTKIADGAVTTAKLNAMGCTNTQILKYDGTSWACATDDVAAATTDASTLTSGVLPDARLSANVSLLGSSIDTSEISNTAVTSIKIADGAITAAKLGISCTNGQILKYNGSSWACSSDNDTATTDASVFTSGILPDARLSSNVSLLGSSIDTADLAANAVTTAKILDSSVTSAKILNGEIVNADISASAAIAEGKLATISTAGKVSGSAITSGTITGSTAINVTGNISAAGNIALNGTGSATSELRFNDSDNSNYVALKAPSAVSANVIWTLPASDGASTYLLSTNGSGTLSWLNPKASGRPCSGGAVRGTYNGHCYARFGEAGTVLDWYAADSFCKAWGGYLAAITSAAEKDYINNNIRGGNEVWIGANDLGTEGQWEWVNGEAWSYTNWTSGEPNDSSGNEECVLINGSGTWNDDKCSVLKKWVCESE